MAIIESLTADEIIARLGTKITAEEVSLALALKAALESPNFTGNPTAPTPGSGDDNTRIATTEFVKNMNYATLTDPAFNGNPTAPTPPTSDNDTSIATTAFVKAAIALLVDSSPATLDTLNELAAALGDDPNFATTITNALGLKANLNGPLFTGDPRAPTPATGDNDTSIATTAFVKAQGYSPLASPTFTGDPKAPTPAQGDNDTSIATTAFVALAIQYMISRQLIELKGDLLVGSANDVISRLAIGGNGTVLTADSAETLGMKWAAATAGLKTYADMTALNAVAAAETGTITLADIGVSLGFAPLNGMGGSVVVITDKITYTPNGDIGWTQFIPAVYDPWNGITYQLVRTRYNATAWGSFEEMPVPQNMYSEFAPLNRGIQVLADTAALDADVSSTPKMFMVLNTDWGAYTGIAELNGINGYAQVFVTRFWTGAAQQEFQWMILTTATKVYQLSRIKSGTWSAWTNMVREGLPYKISTLPPIGNWFTSPYFVGSQSGTTAARPGYFRLPLPIEETVSIDALRFQVGTVGTTEVATFVLQDKDGVQIGAELAVSAALTVGGVIELVFGSPRTLTPGLYYVKLSVTGDSITPRFGAAKVNGPGTGGQNSAAAPDNSAFNTIPFVINNNTSIQFNSPVIYFRRSA